jgi:hypothetical protein
MPRVVHRVLAIDHRLHPRHPAPSIVTARKRREQTTVAKASSQSVFHDAWLSTIQGRECTMDVMEVPDGIPVLIGQLPLEHLDFVVDLRSRTLIGNPAHGGEHVYELL